MKNTGEKNGSDKILLISMPFASPLTPSIQLGTLHAYLKNKGIPADVYHAYLKCADTLGPELYYFISSILFTDELYYPALLYPDHFNKYGRKIKNYYNKTIKKYTYIKPVLFEAVLDKIRSFNEELLTSINFSKYSLIGFSVTYDQLRPSLYLAREIKQKYPHISIVFGGAGCAGELGIGLLESFNEIDFVVSGEGEETLASLFQGLKNKKFNDIKGLIWRSDSSVKFNGPPEKLSAEHLPIPEYEDYFTKLETYSLELKDFIRNHISIPIEGSRGCWWNKCTFCNLNMQYSSYREKSVDQIVHEIDCQVAKYQCQSIRFMDNVQRVNDFDELMKRLKSLKKNLNIFLEIRAGRLKKEDYQLMQSAGVKTVQIGVEAFAKGMLKKMNKGVTTIENIAALKYCQEFGILPLYNLIINYPNESDPDFQESAENINFLKNFVPPASVISMQLCHQSPVFNDAERFNIKEKRMPKNALWFFPDKIWKTFIPLKYNYTKILDLKDKTAEWQELFNAWKQTGEKRISIPLLYYQDSTDFLSITDNSSRVPSKSILKGIERELYLFCDTIQTRENILKRFTNLSNSQMEEITKRWIAAQWMFREGEKFISLAIKLDPIHSPLIYHSVIGGPYSEKYLNRWRPSPPRWKASMNLGNFAAINFSVTTNKIPSWLKRIKRKIIR